MRSKALALVGALLALVTSSACGGDETRTYVVRGQVVRLADGGRQLVVDHEEVPGWMEAMRMAFPLQDPEQGRGLEAGDEIRFELRVSRGRASIGWIERLPADAEPSQPEAGAAG